MRVWIEIIPTFALSGNRLSFHPLMRVWIEIAYYVDRHGFEEFHPLMRVWIEIQVRER